MSLVLVFFCFCFFVLQVAIPSRHLFLCFLLIDLPAPLDFRCHLCLYALCFAGKDNSSSYSSRSQRGANFVRTVWEHWAYSLSSFAFANSISFILSVPCLVGHRVLMVLFSFSSSCQIKDDFLRLHLNNRHTLLSSCVQESTKSRRSSTDHVLLVPFSSQPSCWHCSFPLPFTHNLLAWHWVDIFLCSSSLLLLSFFFSSLDSSSTSFSFLFAFRFHRLLFAFTHTHTAMAGPTGMTWSRATNGKPLAVFQYEFTRLMWMSSIHTTFHFIPQTTHEILGSKSSGNIDLIVPFRIQLAPSIYWYRSALPLSQTSIEHAQVCE